MFTQKNTAPVLLIIVTSIVVYSILRGKKLRYLGLKWRHHIITPAMKTGRVKSKMQRELKKTLAH